MLPTALSPREWPIFRRFAAEPGSIVCVVVCGGGGVDMEDVLGMETCKIQKIDSDNRSTEDQWTERLQFSNSSLVQFANPKFFETL